MDFTERGLLRLSQRLRPSHGTDMVVSMAMDSQPMVPTVDTAMDFMERGLLMLSLRLRLSHGTDMVVSMATDSLPTDTAMASTAMVLATAMVATPTASNQHTTF